MAIIFFETDEVMTELKYLVVVGLETEENDVSCETTKTALKISPCT